MKQIHIISQLDINLGKVVSTHNGEYEPVFLKQGDLDGACGPYCVMMVLLTVGAVNRNNVSDLWNVKGNTRLGKLLKAMRDHDTLFKDGTTMLELASLLDSSFGKIVNTIANESHGRKLIPFVTGELDKDKPVIVRVKNKNLAHWLMAVGYESDNDNIVKIFFLDPSGIDTSNYWNAAIDIYNIQGGIYPYAWIDHNEDTNEYVQFEEALSIMFKA